MFNGFPFRAPDQADDDAKQQFLDILADPQVFRDSDPLQAQAFRSLDLSGGDVQRSADVLQPFDHFSSASSPADHYAASKGLGLKGLDGASVGVPTYEVLEDSAADLDLPVDDLPVYYDKYTSFTSNAFPREIIQEVRTVLASDISVEFEVATDKHKIKGVVCRENKAAQFRVHVFKKDASYVVEFQRRSGDAFMFGAFFSDVAHAVSKIVSSPLPSQRAALAVPELPADLPVPPEAEESTLNCLFEMATSGCLDVEREALRCLSSLSSESAHREALVTSKTTSAVLSRQLNSGDWELQRCAATMLANLANSADADGAWFAPLLDGALNCLKATTSQETRRQLIAGLSSLSKLAPCAASMKRSDFAATLQSMSRDAGVHALLLRLR